MTRTRIKGGATPSPLHSPIRHTPAKNHETDHRHLDRDPGRSGVSGDDALVTGYGFGGQSFPPPATCPTGIERLDPATGNRLTFVPGRMPVGPAVTSGDHVAVVTTPIDAGCVRGDERRFEVRDRATLALQYSFTPADGAIDGSVPTFANAGDEVVVADGSDLLAFPAAGCGALTCQPKWSAHLPNVPGVQVGTFDTAAFSDGVVFVKAVLVTAASPGQPPNVFDEVQAIDPATGRLLAQGDLASGAGTLAVRGSTVYYVRQPSFATDVVEVRATQSCESCTTTQFTPLWSATVEGSFFSAQATVAGDVVYAGTVNSAGKGRVVALAADGCGAATCDPLATVPITGSALELSVSSGRVFAATTLGNSEDFALSALSLP
jgi:hypothetical protein